MISRIFTTMIFVLELMEHLFAVFFILCGEGGKYAEKEKTGSGILAVSTCFAGTCLEQKYGKMKL